MREGVWTSCAPFLHFNSSLMKPCWLYQTFTSSSHRSRAPSPKGNELGMKLSKCLVFSKRLFSISEKVNQNHIIFKQSPSFLSLLTLCNTIVSFSYSYLQKSFELMCQAEVYTDLYRSQKRTQNKAKYPFIFSCWIGVSFQIFFINSSSWMIL